MSLPAISALNSATNDDFIEAVHVLFEPAPPLAERLLQRRPFQTYDEIIDAADEIIQNMCDSDKVIVVNAHPRIGAPTQTLSALSKKEQGAPVENLDAVLARLAVLNQQYENKFGFKFVVFVNGRSRAEIVSVLEGRMHNSRAMELATGLRDMIAIARDRLSKIQIH
jgi:OHCU decarboxylase